MSLSVLAATLGTIVFPLLLVYAGVMDFLTLKIRNALVLTLAACWLVLAPLAGFTLAELGWSAGVAAIVFAVTFTFFAFGWIGGGDAKLAPVAALWFAPTEVLSYFLYTALLGGLLTLMILQLRTRPLPAAWYRSGWLANLRDKRNGVPYGAAMAPAALIVFPSTAWFQHAAF
jgi:prepilin peptidase CpaA